MSVVVWTLHTDEKSFVLNPIITKFSQIIALMSTAIWPILVKIGLKTKKNHQKFPELHNFKKIKHCWEELEEKNVRQSKSILDTHRNLISNTWPIITYTCSTLLLKIRYIHIGSFNKPQPLWQISWRTRKNTQFTDWQYKRGLELTSWDFL